MKMGGQFHEMTGKCPPKCQVSHKHWDSMHENVLPNVRCLTSTGTVCMKMSSQMSGVSQALGQYA